MAYTTIDDPTSFFNTVLYTGDGNTSRGITGVGFQPDWLWIKRRDATEGHVLFDVVRSADARLQSNNSSVEADRPNIVYSFDSDGFSVSQSDIDNASNNNGGTYVAWNWLAGTSVSGNSGGNGTAKAYSGSVNTTSGFSIIKYIGNATDGQTIPHHLGVTPAVVIVKNLDATSGDTNWSFLHKIHFGTNNHLYLNLTNATDSNANRFSGTAPTSSNFTLGGADAVNKNDSDHIAYVFAEKQGYSKIASYTGNGNADGAFVYTGFKPAWILLKDTGSTQAWFMYDNTRDTINPNTKILIANTNGAEEDSASTGNTFDIDFVSNGFKIKTTDSGVNASGNTYVYMAFAESPFVNSNGVPCNAR